MPLMSEMVSAGIQSHRAQAIIGSGVAADLTAAGTDQATALQLAAASNQIISTAAAASGVRLPLGCSNGDEIRIRNSAAEAVAVYNPTGGDDVSLGAVAAGSSVVAKCISGDGLTWVLI